MTVRLAPETRPPAIEIEPEMKTEAPRKPGLLVLSSLFPRPEQPNMGTFIRERMFRVGQELPIVVVAPVPWFPMQSLLRRLRPHFRPEAEYHVNQDGVDVFYPRFFSVPGLFKHLDGLFMALGSFRTCRRLLRERNLHVIDAHFVYPDGNAAYYLSKWLGVRFTVTARGTESRLVRLPRFRERMRATVQSAAHLFAVSKSLEGILLSLGADASKTSVVGNAVDTSIFHRVDKRAARERLGVPADATVLVSVGVLVERKGFHRVIDCLPDLLPHFPRLMYLVVGGSNPEGDWRARLERKVEELGLQNHVRFLGALPSEELKVPLSAADIFVLATRNEGWANVFLEAMACGLPVVTTDVGGNREVVRAPEQGLIVPFGDRNALAQAMRDALTREWNRDAIIAYAAKNNWEQRVSTIVDRIEKVVRDGPTRGQP